MSEHRDPEFTKELVSASQDLATLAERLSVTLRYKGERSPGYYHLNEKELEQVHNNLNVTLGHIHIALGPWPKFHRTRTDQSPKHNAN